eukprot:3656785-Rhodomonas_salina.1
MRNGSSLSVSLAFTHAFLSAAVSFPFAAVSFPSVCYRFGYGASARLGGAPGAGAAPRAAGARTA